MMIHFYSVGDASTEWEPNKALSIRPITSIGTFASVGRTFSPLNRSLFIHLLIGADLKFLMNCASSVLMIKVDGGLFAHFCLKIVLDSSGLLGIANDGIRSNHTSVGRKA